MQAEQLIATAERAPYGRGEKTLTDLEIRRTWQIAAERIAFTGKHWPATLAAIVARIAETLGIDGEVTASPYKLLIYDTGSFFVPHRDTEKLPGMFATLVIALPSTAEGGELIVSHKGEEKRIDLRCPDPSELAFAAFYGDCVYEVRPVTAGYRLVLIYNLARRGRKPLPKPPEYTTQQSRLATALTQWATAARDGDPVKLIYPLAHAYTEAEIGFHALKGADAALAAVVAAAAATAGCDVHLALISIEETRGAEYGEAWQHKRRRGYHDHDEDADGMEPGELYDRTAIASHWRRPDDTQAPLGDIPILEAEFSPPVEFETLEPDEQHFHEAAGNEGASFERSYSRAALILWPKSGSLAVINQGGRHVALPYLAGLAADWQSRGDHAAWDQAHVLSGHIISSWKTQGYLPGHGNRQSDTAAFLDTLVRLGDTNRIDAFLMSLSGKSGFESVDAPSIVTALRSLAPARAAELAARLVQNAAAPSFAACARLLALLSAGHANLAKDSACHLAAAMPGDPRRPAEVGWRTSAAVLPESVADLMAALARVDQALAVAAANTICGRPAIYDPDNIVVPATENLVALPDIAQTQAITILRAACLRHLAARIAQPLEPPTNWRRDANLACKCKDCSALAAYLADPGQKRWVFAAAEYRRNHLEQTMRAARSDVTTTTERRGSPYKLLCAKTQASYERRCRQRDQDLAAVNKLRPA